MKPLQNFRTVQSPGHRESFVSAVMRDARREDSVSGGGPAASRYFYESSILRYVQYNKEDPEHARNWNQIVKYNIARNALRRLKIYLIHVTLTGPHTLP